MFAPRPDTTEDVVYARQGVLGRVRLNRPRAINALTHPMVRSLRAQLADWAGDDTVGAVVIDGAGDRGLCSGGDVRMIRQAIMDGAADPAAFWVDEYRLNAQIAHYPKPVVSVMDGVTMGGGVGLAGFASVRIATVRSRIAMPETAIGFFPDVGGRYLLSRAPGELGTHLGLTGLPVGGADAVRAGLADVVADPDRLPAVLDGWADGRTPTAETVAELAPVADPPAETADNRAWIDRCYQGDDPAAILAALRADPDERARRAGEVVASRAPLSVAVTLEGLRRAARLDLDAVLAQDLVLGRAFLDNPDFVEGVRAVLVDRDPHPKWQHSALSEVDPGLVKRIFEG